MGIYAKLDSDSVVTELILVSVGTEGEDLAWLADNFEGNWMRTFSAEKVALGQDSVRHVHPAGVGMTYRADLGAFIAVSPHPSWVLNEETFEWDCPVEEPNNFNEDGSRILVVWDEASLSWLAKDLT